MILVLVFAEVAAVAMYYRNGLFGVFHREIEYLRDVFLALLGRGVALREFGFALYERFGESVATRVEIGRASCRERV